MHTRIIRLIRTQTITRYISRRYLKSYNMVEYGVDRNIAIIRLDNPPLNLLSHQVRVELNQSLHRADEDQTVKGVVVCGKNNIFSAGGDITEFDKPVIVPWITHIGHYIDGMKKPVVAAMDGAVIGGGLEIALFCHYRIATNKTRTGFPEGQIGLTPGGGGSQRLPRAVGFENALKMISTGNIEQAERALKMGIFDEIVEGGLVEKGIELALSKTHIDIRCVCLRNRDIKLPRNHQKCIDDTVMRLNLEHKGCHAYLASVHSVTLSATLPYDKGMEKEWEIFEEQRISYQSKALRYAFFADRTVTKWKLPNGENYKTTKPLPLRTIGVLGAGTLGISIAISLITSDIPCIIIEQNKQILEKGIELVNTQLKGEDQSGEMSESRAKRYLSILNFSSDLHDLNGVDLIFDSLSECSTLTHKILSDMHRFCKSSTIMCLNSYTLNFDKIASEIKNQTKVIGTYFHVPFNSKLLEIAYGKYTSAETVATVMKLARTIKKIPVLVKGNAGSLGNRMKKKYISEVTFLLGEGANISNIANVLESNCMPTFNNFEQAGFKESNITHNNESSMTYLESREQDILERLQYSMINEGFKLMEEGLVATPQAIDVICFYGLSWPKQIGGPMFIANQKDRKHIYERIQYYHHKAPENDNWMPSKLLMKACEENTSMDRWGSEATGQSKL